jgi:ATP-dependent DNA helicase RecQ
MKQRMHADSLEEDLFTLVKKQALRLKAEHGIAALVPLPSRTWKARNTVATALAEGLSIPVFLDLLIWKTPPEKRQGELLNNDQRQHNVEDHMALQGNIPEGPILLFDDYIGSGASMKEAARTLRQALSHPLIPLTIAAIKWHLGKPGFI